MKTDIIIVGSGVSGLYCALNLPKDKNIIIITKDKADKSDSYLAQGGICVLRDEADFDAYFEDTMRAGHWENDKESVEIMIASSRDVIEDLVDFGVRFHKENGEFAYTKEGAHSKPRILYHEDETGKEITSVLLKKVRELSNVKILEHHTLVDIFEDNGSCAGVICLDEAGNLITISSDYTVLATGGIGGLYKHSTNYEHLTGDAIAIAHKHNIELKNMDYIQIHPTALYTKDKGREFLISESVRGEGAILLSVKGERFVNDIYEQMEKDGSDFVLLSLKPIPEEELLSHFPNIYGHCLSKGYDITKEPIPVVPSQHYFMGGIKVDSDSKTSMDRLYAIGETSCNGVHGKNSLASNSLLESLVFAKRSANHIMSAYSPANAQPPCVDASAYANYKEEYKRIVLDTIEKEKKDNE